MPREFTFIGVARRALDDARYHEYATSAAREFATRPLDDALWAEFAERVHYVKGDFEDPETYSAIGAALSHVGEHGSSGSALFYLATPPSEFGAIGASARPGSRERTRAGGASSSRSCSATTSTPRGRSTGSSPACSGNLRSYRIDHYLGKEIVQNLMVPGSRTGCSSPFDPPSAPRWAPDRAAWT